MRASTKVSLTAVIALALAAPAFAQDSRRPTGSGSSTGGSATSRGGGSSSGGSSAGSSSSGGSVSSGGSSVGRTAVSRPSREPSSSARRPSGGTASGGGPVIPAYSRPRGGNSVRGQAVDRGDNPLPGRGGIYYYPYYNGYFGNSRYYYGYPVYTGFGYFYYDPYWGYYDPFYSRGYYAYGPYGTRYKDKDDRDYNIGSLRLKIEPSHAEVYVDGLYRGIVDDFDGLLQRLKLEAGAHRLEVRAAGMQTLVFDVLVTPGETTTYRGHLKR
jgi:hypothetical protein